MIRRNVLSALLIFVSIIQGIGQSTTVEYGEASYYADGLHGKKTASGEIYYHNEYTAAHKTLPFGTWVRVENLANEKSVLVRINDRGPYIAGRIIDLSKYAARDLDMLKSGVARVKIEVLPKIPGNTQINLKLDNGQNKSFLKNFYKISIHKTTPEGFGVQIRSYRDLSNLLNESEHWPSGMDAEVFVEVAGEGDKKIYRILLGEFNTKREAEKFKEKIDKDFPGCFVVKY